MSALLPLFRFFLRLAGGRFFRHLRARWRFAQHARHGFADLGGALDRVDSRGAQRGVLFLGGAFSAADDCAGVAHAAARWRRLPCNKTNHGLLYVFLYEVRGDFLGVAADFADHHDRLGFRIVVKHANRVEKARPDDRIAADAEAGRLPDAESGELPDGFIGKRAAATHHADPAAFMNRGRHDAELALAGRNNARAVRSDQPRLRIFQRGSDADHIEHRYAFRDADRQRQPGVDGFENRIRSERRRHECDRSGRTGRAPGFGDGVEDRDTEMLRTALAGGHSGNNLRAVIHHLLRMKTSLAAREALHHDASFLVDENAHRAPPASATAFSAPSFIPSATEKLRPELRRICWPSRTLVPSMRTTTGTSKRRSLARPTIPLASMSQRKIPPNTLMKTAFTFGSLSKMRNAFFTRSSDASPPTSRKFAGLPPLSLMMSIVAMARPAPFTMQAMLPSSLM